MRFTDRPDAGRQLADALVARLGDDLRRTGRTVVVGLARGGIPVAAPVAVALGAPLDVLVVRKLGLPWAPEVAFGALGSGGVYELNPDVADAVSTADIGTVIERELQELQRREHLYRPGRPAVALTNNVAVIVDDGWATGATARAGVAVARKRGAAKVVAAAPVAAPAAVDAMNRVADLVVCLAVPPDFLAVSRYYQHFPQVTDGEVAATLGSFA
jgi:predicted phosphoribosyltransferase